MTMAKETKEAKGTASVAPSPPRPPNVVSVLLFVGVFGAGLAATLLLADPLWVIAGSVVGLLLASSPRVAKQWERAIVLRLGQFAGARGPGLFWIIPGIDTIAAWIDHRIITTTFAAEESLTADTVPVNVDAVLFWMVNDAEKAALGVQD